MSTGNIRLQHYAWAGVNTTNSIYHVVITSVPEQYGEKFMGDQPNLYFRPVAFLYIRTFTDGFQMKLPAIPIQQQEVYYTQPMDGNIGRSSTGFLILEPGVVGTVTEVRQ